jgi:hypothetical protein
LRVPAGPDPDDPASPPPSNHAIVLRNLGRFEEAEPLYREAIGARSARSAAASSVANSQGQLGSLMLEDRGDVDRRTDVPQALAIHRKRSAIAIRSWRSA